MLENQTANVKLCVQHHDFVAIPELFSEICLLFFKNQISLVGFCHLLRNPMPGLISVEKIWWSAIHVSVYVSGKARRESFCSGL